MKTRSEQNVSKRVVHAEHPLRQRLKRNEMLQAKATKQQAKQDKLQGKIGLVHLQLDQEDAATAKDDAEDEKLIKDLEKVAKKDARLQKRLDRLKKQLINLNEKWKTWEQKHPSERITTEDAEMLIALMKEMKEKIGLE